AVCATAYNWHGAAVAAGRADRPTPDCPQSDHRRRGVERWWSYFRRAAVGAWRERVFHRWHGGVHADVENRPARHPRSSPGGYPTVDRGVRAATGPIGAGPARYLLGDRRDRRDRPHRPPLRGPTRPRMPRRMRPLADVHGQPDSRTGTPRP